MDRNAATAFVAELRATYPDPSRTPNQIVSPNRYCVGGALAHAFGLRCNVGGTGAVPSPMNASGRTQPDVLSFDEIAGAISDGGVEVGMFPSADLLALVLTEANPILNGDTALEFARRIARKNDTGNFETAWQTLEDALAWAPSWTAEDDVAVIASARDRRERQCVKQHGHSPSRSRCSRRRQRPRWRMPPTHRICTTAFRRHHPPRSAVPISRRRSRCSQR